MFNNLIRKMGCRSFVIIFIIIFVGLNLNATDIYIVINGTVTTQQKLYSDDNLYVTTEGNLTVSNQALLLNDSDINIDNSGIIHSTSDTAIDITQQNLTGTIINKATGIIKSDTSYGINLGNFDNDGIIKNEGNVIANIAGLGLGNNNSLIANDGNITTNFYGIVLNYNANTGIIENNGTIDSKQPIFVGINDGNITNNGILQGNSGIWIHYDSNNGIIENNGTINTTISSGIVLFEGESGTNNGTVLNIGTITSESADGIYIYAGGSNALTGKIINEGNITVGKNGLSIEGINNGSISNSGTIVANQDGIYVGLNQGNILNSGTIVANNYAIDIGYAGTGTVTNSGTINGNLNITSTGLVTNSGTINLNGATTSTIAGDYTQTSNGILGIDADIASATDVNYSKLAIAGTATLYDGTNIRVDVNGTNINQIKFLLSDSALTNVITANTLDVNVSTLNITDNSFILNFIAVKNNNALDLNITRASTIEEAIKNAGTVLQNGGVAKTLDNMAIGINDDIDTFKAYLYTLPTEKTISQAVASTTPTLPIATSTVGRQLINTMSHVIESRQASIKGFNSGDKLFTNKNIWIKPFKEYTKQDNTNNITGFSANSSGVGIGIDGEYTTGCRAGLAFFYTNANVNTNDIDQNSNLNVFNIIAYGSNPVIDDKTNLFYQIGYGIQKTNTSRTIMGLNKTATADYNAQSYYLQLKETRNIKINERFNIRPAVIISYIYYKNPSYTESGADGVNLHIDNFDSNSFIMGVENDFNYNINKNTKIISNLTISYDFSNKAQTVNANFTGGGATFSTEGIKNNPLIYKVGLGVAVKLNKDNYIDFKYDFNGRGSDFLNQVISAKFNYKF